jgi:uncharacterized protein (TIRG00374 family)
MTAFVRRRSAFLAWLAGLALLIWVLHRVSLPESWALLRQLDGAAILVLILANGLVLLTLSGRWWLILRAQGHHMPYLTLAGYRLSAFGLSYFTPGPQFGGEPLQVILPERRHGVPRESAVAAVALDKSLELLVNFAFLAGGIALIVQQGLLSRASGGPALVGSFLLLALPVLFLTAIAAGRHPLSSLMNLASFLTIPASWQTGLQRWQRGLRNSEAQVTFLCRHHPRALVLALTISLISWLAMIAETWLALYLLGTPLAPIQVLAVLIAGRVSYLAAMPSGLGVLEASQVFMLGALGVNPAVGIGLSVLIRARDVILGSLGLFWGARQLRRSNPYPAIQAEHTPIDLESSL